METTVAKIVYSPCPPSSKDVIWGKTVNGKIEFQTFGNKGWNTVAKEDILKDIFHIKEEILEELEDYIEEVTSQADWNQNDETAPDFIKNRICYDEGDTILLTGNVIINSATNYSFNVISDTLPEPTVGGQLYLRFSSLTEIFETVWANNYGYGFTFNLQSVGGECGGNWNYDDPNKIHFTGGGGGASIPFSEGDTFILFEKNIQQIPIEFIPDTIARLSDVKDGISLDVVYCEDSTGYMFDRSKYYDVSTVTDVTFTIPAITKAEIYKGTLHSASITVPSETFITGDKSLLTISGTTITASSSKWYTWTYDSYTKEMKFSMYKEI